MKEIKQKQKIQQIKPEPEKQEVHIGTEDAIWMFNMQKRSFEKRLKDLIKLIDSTNFDKLQQVNILKKKIRRLATWSFIFAKDFETLSKFLPESYSRGFTRDLKIVGKQKELLDDIDNPDFD